jgi:hypothetical protein
VTTTATPNYVQTTTHTINPASLATDSTLLAGVEGTAIDNVTEDAIDAILGGFFTTGTSPTVNKQIEVWVYGSYDGTTFSGDMTGTATTGGSTKTPSAKSTMKLAAVITVDATSNKKYSWCSGSVAALFGGVLPRKWGVYVVQNTGAALNSTAGNHEVKHSLVKFESA